MSIENNKRQLQNFFRTLIATLEIKGDERDSLRQFINGIANERSFDEKDLKLSLSTQKTKESFFSFVKERLKEQNLDTLSASSQTDLEEEFGFNDPSDLLKEWANKYREELQEREEAAIKIQSAWRGYKARKDLKAEKEEEKAAIKIQSVARGFLARMRYRKLKKERKVVEEYEKFLKEKSPEELNSEATKIQAAVRGWNARKKMLQENAAATKIQAAVRGWNVRKNKAEQEFDDKNKSKKKQISKEEGADPKKNAAATTIQAAWRGWNERKNNEELQNQLKEKKEERQKEQEKKKEHDKREEAAIKIQAAARGFLERARQRKKKKALNDDDFPKIFNREEFEAQELDLTDRNVYRVINGRFEVVSKVPENALYRSIHGHSQARAVKKAEDEIAEKFKQEALKQHEKALREQDPEIDDDSVKIRLDEFAKSYRPDRESPEFRNAFHKRYQKKVGEAIELQKNGLYSATYDIEDEGMARLQDHIAQARQLAKDARSGESAVIVAKFRGELTEPELDSDGRVIYEEKPATDINGKTIVKDGKVVMQSQPRTTKRTPPTVIVHQNGPSVTQSFVKPEYIENRIERLAQALFENEGKEYTTRAFAQLPEDMDATKRHEKAAAMARSAIREEANRQIKQEIQQSAAASRTQYDNAQQAMEGLKQQCGTKYFSNKKAKSGAAALRDIAPVTGVDGISILKAPHDPYSAKVLFRRESQEKDPIYETAYINIPGTNCFVLAHFANTDGNIVYYENGKAKNKTCKAGEVVLDVNTIHHLDKRTGAYVPICVNTVRSSRFNARRLTNGAVDEASLAKSKNGVRGIKDYFIVDAQRVQNAYKKMSIEVTSQLGTESFAALKLSGTGKAVSASMSKVAGKKIEGLGEETSKDEISRRLPKIGELSLNKKSLAQSVSFVDLPRFDRKIYGDDDRQRRAESELCLKVCVAERDGPVVLNDGTMIPFVPSGTRYIHPLPYKKSQIPDGSAVKRDELNYYSRNAKKLLAEIAKTKPLALKGDEIVAKERRFLAAVEHSDYDQVQKLLGEYLTRKREILDYVAKGSEIQTEEELKIRMELASRMMKECNFNIFAQNAVSKGAMNALHIAAAKGDKQMLDMLLGNDGKFADLGVEIGFHAEMRSDSTLGTKPWQKPSNPIREKKLRRIEDANFRNASAQNLRKMSHLDIQAQIVPGLSAIKARHDGANAMQIAKKLHPKNLDLQAALSNSRKMDFGEEIKKINREQPLDQLQKDYDLAQTVLQCAQGNDFAGVTSAMAEYRARKEEITEALEKNATKFSDQRKQATYNARRAMLVNSTSFDLTRAKNADGLDALQIACRSNPDMAALLLDNGFTVKPYHHLGAPENLRAMIGEKMITNPISDKYYIDITPVDSTWSHGRVYISAQKLKEDAQINRVDCKAGEVVFDKSSIFVIGNSGFKHFSANDSAQFPPAIKKEFPEVVAEFLKERKDSVIAKFVKNEEGLNRYPTYLEGDFGNCKDLKLDAPAKAVQPHIVQHLKTGRELNKKNMDDFTKNNSVSIGEISV